MLNLLTLSRFSMRWCKSLKYNRFNLHNLKNKNKKKKKKNNKNKKKKKNKNKIKRKSIYIQPM